jgi:hypothetical protein
MILNAFGGKDIPCRSRLLLLQRIRDALRLIDFLLKTTKTTKGNTMFHKDF